LLSIAARLGTISTQISVVPHERRRVHRVLKDPARNREVTVARQPQSLHHAGEWQLRICQVGAVFTDRGMFEALPSYVKLYSVLEEAYVLALER
jgi:hypothetical protein